MTTVGPYYSAVQLIFVGTLSWHSGAFSCCADSQHRDYFLDAPGEEPDVAHEKPSDKVALLSLALLLVSLAAVVLLARFLSIPLDQGIAAVGLPQAFVGVVIAADRVVAREPRGGEVRPS